MRKLFLTLSFTLLFVIKVFGQAAVDITFSATDSVYYSIELSVGLDLTATNCIDPLLGEGGSPAIPPPGIFDIRFDLDQYGCPIPNDTFKDYRPPGNPPAFPFTGTIEHTLLFQVSTPGIDLNIDYDLPVGTEMTIVDPINGTFVNLGPLSGAGTAVIPGSYTLFGTKCFLTMDYDAIVPVELVSFTATVLDEQVHLDWTTATETNNSGFEIQRTSPLPFHYQGEGGEAGRGWEKIGFIPGFGTTTEPKSYSFIDEAITTGNYKYRLKQIDFDGSFEYSDVVNVFVSPPIDYNLEQNYPNPFNPETRITYEIAMPGHVTLRIHRIDGQLIRTLQDANQSPGRYERIWDGNNEFGNKVSSGVYFYRMQSNNFSQVRKMMLLK